MCSWLIENKDLTVAMESTGVLLAAVYEACEEFLHGYICLMV
jgi:hypothetical protein